MTKAFKIHVLPPKDYANGFGLPPLEVVHGIRNTSDSI